MVIRAAAGLRTGPDSYGKVARYRGTEDTALTAEVHGL